MTKLIIKSNICLVFILLISIIGLFGCEPGASGAGGTGSSAQDLVMQIKSKLPPVGNNLCGFGVESPVRTNDCITNNETFYNGKDNTIRFVLSTLGGWSDSDINQLLSKPMPEERYAYYLEHNKGPLTLQCDKGLQNAQQDSCKPAMFGNAKFQIDYLLCPNLVNQYLTLTSDDWTLRLNQIFVYCAVRGQLPNQCQSPRNILITTPESLKTGDRFTFTAREICLLLDEGLNLNPLQSQARYNIFNFSQ